MRDFKGMKRQRGRNRSGGKPQQHNANRAFDSNGPEGIKVRGAAQSVFDKYQQLARDAATAGDRVLAENYLQHAEHYFRLIRAVQPNRPVAEIVGRDQYSSGFDIDFEAEPPEEAPEAPAEAEAPAEGAEGEERPRFEGRRDRDRFNRDRDRDRDDRPRDDRQRDDRQRDDRQRDDRPRDDRPRDDRPRDDRPREEREGGRRDRWRDRDRDRDRGDRGDRGERERGDRDRGETRDPLAVIEPQAAPLAPEPASEGSPRLRGQDGAVSELPGFLSRPADPREEPAGEEPARKPRRRRAPKSFEGGDAPSENEDA